MKQVLEFIADGQLWIYGLLAPVLLFYLGRALMARRDYRRSLFRLVRELARTRIFSSAQAMAVGLFIMAAVFSSSTFLLPALDQPPPTPTVVIATDLPAPTLTPAPTAPEPTPSPTDAPTWEPATPTPTATAKPKAQAKPKPKATNPPAVAPPACPNPNVRLTSPGANQEVRGSTPVRGTANIADLQFYKIEVGAGKSPSTWSVVGQLQHGPVVNGLLVTFNSSGYPPGIYTLRLVTVDTTGNYPEPCSVIVEVKR